MESLPARTQCLASSDGKRMSADLSELEPKLPFAPAGRREREAQQQPKPEISEWFSTFWGPEPTAYFNLTLRSSGTYQITD